MSYGGAAAGLAALVLALKRRQLVGAFDRVGATSPGAARRREELGIRDSRLFHRLASRGVLRATADGAYFLDRGTLARSRRRRLVVLAIVALLVAVGVAVVLSGGP